MDIKYVKSPVYMIRVTDNLGDFNDVTKKAWMNLIDAGHEPGLVFWKDTDTGDTYSDVMMIISGVSIKEVLRYMSQYDQDCIVSLNEHGTVDLIYTGMTVADGGSSVHFFKVERSPKAADPEGLTDMAALSTASHRTFKNTFAPNVRNEDLPAFAVVEGLRRGAIQQGKLPPKVRKAVREELDRQKAERVKGSGKPPKTAGEDSEQPPARGRYVVKRSPVASKDSSVKKFRNTFAPKCTNRYLSVDNIIIALRIGLLHMSKLPPKVRREVTDELEHRLACKRPGSPGSGHDKAPA